MYFWVDLRFGHVILDSLIEKDLLIRVHKPISKLWNKKMQNKPVIYRLFSFYEAFFSLFIQHAEVEWWHRGILIIWD